MTRPTGLHLTYDIEHFRMHYTTFSGGADCSYHADFGEIAPSYDPPENLVAESGHSG